jgi:serine protease inhibitor
VVVLPNKQGGLAQLEKKLLTTSLSELLQRATIKTVQLYLPKFKIETTLDLKKPLGKVKYCFLFSQ